jgi:hypothetical protein
MNQHTFGLSCPFLGPAQRQSRKSEHMQFDDGTKNQKKISALKSTKQQHESWQRAF